MRKTKKNPQSINKDFSNRLKELQKNPIYSKLLQEYYKKTVDELAYFNPLRASQLTIKEYEKGVIRTLKEKYYNNSL